MANIIDDSKEAIRTARSALRSKLLELATLVDKNKHPQTEITEGIRELTNLNAKWVQVDTDMVYQTISIQTDTPLEKTQEKIEELKEHERQGIDVEE